MSWVQLHERVWGVRQYPQRPTLDAIMRAQVVTFWRPYNAKVNREERMTIRLFDDVRDVERYYTKLLFRVHVEPPRDALARVFVDQKRMVVRSVRILLQEWDKD